MLLNRSKYKDVYRHCCYLKLHYTLYTMSDLLLFFQKFYSRYLSPQVSHLMITDLSNWTISFIDLHCGKTVSAQTNRHINILQDATNQQNLARQQSMPAIRAYTSGTFNRRTVKHRNDFEITSAFDHVSHFNTFERLFKVSI